MKRFTPLKPRSDQIDELVPELRAMRVKAALVRLGLWNEEWKIGGYVQEPQISIDDGGGRHVLRERAVFILMSPHPLQRGEEMMTFAHTRLEDFREAEAENRHSTDGDPLIAIFSAIAREHINRTNDLKGLTDGGPGSLLG